MGTVATVIVFLLVLSVLVLVHELGHFVMAKRAGLRVDEFGFGFPPRLYGKKIGETIYTVNAIPLGGFVRIRGVAGDDPEAAKSDPPSNSFLSCSPVRKFGILFAGIVMNLIFAVVLFSAVFLIGTTLGADQVEYGAIVSGEQLFVSAVGEDTPAAAAGLEPGDIIASVNGQAVVRGEFQELIPEYEGRPVRLEVERLDRQFTVEVVPREVSFSEVAYVGIGVGIEDLVTVRYPLPLAFWQGLKMTVWMTGQIVMALVDLLVTLVTGGGVGDQVSGPVGIAVLTGQVASAGTVQLLQFVALLSINLALFNLLPIPALDGGRIIFVIVEQLKGSPVNQRIEGIVHTVGFGALLLLVLIVTVREVGLYF